MGSPSTGRSGLTGSSSFNGVLDDKGAWSNVMRFHAQVINAGLLELIARLQAFGRNEVDAWDDFSAMKKSIERAIELGEKGIVQEAVSQIRDAYQEFCYNPDVPENDKKAISNAFYKLYPQLLNQENDIRREELQKMCDDVILECEKHGGDSEAWEEFKGVIEDAYKNAQNKSPLQLEFVKCKAESLPVAQKNMEKAGVATKIFYGAGNKDGYIIVPKAGKDIERLARAAVIDAAVKCEQSNILSEESMSTIMQLRGQDDRREMTGLTLAEAEAVVETMYGKNAPIVLKEPAEPGGHFSIVYCKENEELVNSVVLQEMIRERGAGYNAHVGDILETNYKARQGADLLLSKLSEGMDTYGYVVDVDHPEHYLLVTSKGIVENYENGEKDFVKFEKTPNPTNYSVELKERTMQLAPRIMFLPAKEAKACGLTRDEYMVSEELKKKLETVRNPNNKVVTANRSTPEETEKYKNEVQAAVSAQTMFARYAVGQARDNMPQNASLPMLTQYIAQNTPELIASYKHECMRNIENKQMSEKDKDKAIGRLDYAIQSLRGQTKLNASIEDTIKEVYNQIAPEDARVKAVDYQAPMFTATRLDLQTISEQEIMEFRQNMRQVTATLTPHQEEKPKETQQKTAEARQTKTATKTKHKNIDQKTAAQKKPEKIPIDVTIKKNEKQVEMYIQKLSAKFPPEKAKAIAVSNVFMTNMEAAIIHGADLPPADKYLKEYGIIPEEAACRISARFEKVSGINCEMYDRKADGFDHIDKNDTAKIEKYQKELDGYKDQLEVIIKKEVQKEVSDGMKEIAARQAIDRNDER